jgi:hypothetical protein
VITLGVVKQSPKHLSITKLIDGRPVFEFTKKEAARFSKERMIVHMRQELAGTEGEDNGEDAEEKKSEL